MWRLSEGPLERSQEMIRAQLHEIGQHVERNVPRKVLFHEIHDALLLPPHKSARAVDASWRRSCAIETQEFVRQQTRKYVGIHTIAGVDAADLRLELADGFPNIPVLEQQPRLQFGLCESQIGIDQDRLWIDV